MRTFVTGATGWIGQAVIKELLSAGHQVLGLSRSDAGTKKLESLGAEVHLGSLQDLESLKAGAAASDAVIHCAFTHDFKPEEKEGAQSDKEEKPVGDFVDWCRIDRVAIETIGAALLGTKKPFVVTSGTLLLPQGRLVTENDLPDLSTPLAAARGPSETATIDLAKQGVHAMVIRLAPTNHGEGDKGFIAMMIATARKIGKSAYIGEGHSRWPAVHRLDTARLYKLALEKGSAGSIYHAVAEEAVLVKDIAEAIGQKLGLPTISMGAEEVLEHYGFLGLAMGGNNPTSNVKTKNELGWEPKEIPLLEDIKQGKYFTSV
ncbi:NAD dependent epimerase/dehydratase family protein [Pseudovirgaria hyperparasitica]|uniref:NAD dependent epimerase/dehydratase family protein n=1 Tax=Pseudovirgaria hyperparasitica TaxID=470096 RepID=A0A6A6WAI4_9PEZI|nr:NAD dependent epimerase/dehydratase family protein [Pseudovirgaria hyperparasitica]KAF2759683.1 NAD dependent epimerase/dehydratase family protein [Pseudovirgaria hyperparasitica]